MKIKFFLSLFLLLSLGLTSVTISSCNKNSSDDIIEDPIQDNSFLLDSVDTELEDFVHTSIDPAPQGVYANVEIEIVTRRQGAIYAINEPIYFDVKAESNGFPVTGCVEYSLSNDGVTSLRTGSAELRNGKAEIVWKQNDPMIVQCTVTYKTIKNKVFSGVAAAAIDPFDIKTVAVLPDDFMSFWNGKIADLAKIPVNAQLTAVDDNVYDITLDNINGTRLHAYLGVPSGNGPFPSLLSIPGGGVTSASQNTAKIYADKGFLVLAISVHDQPNGQSDEFYKQLEAGPLKQYYWQGRENRESYYFKRTILGCIRAIDYLTSHPKWDQNHMIVYGSSQGGALTLITTSLDQRVTSASAGVPSWCEHNGKEFGRPCGGPNFGLVPIDAEGNLDPVILATSRYYDAVNFARYIKVPMLFAVGLLDNVCPPTTVFSAYNQLNGTKDIDIAPLMGHGNSDSYKEKRNRFFIKYSDK